MRTKRSSASRRSLFSDASPGRRRGPRRHRTKSHFSSQTSNDVPATVKNQVKLLQEKRCWLCNQKAHKRNRPLQIAHVLAQAGGKRPLFVQHHKSGRTQLSNIHDKANLIALCEVCRTAFDQKEWTFLPQEMSTWLRDAKADPKEDYIQHWNGRRDIQFRRWRLLPDPDSVAFKDEHFKSAFTNYPVKKWAGEVGAVILTNINLCGMTAEELDEDLVKALEEYDELREMWISYKSPCSEKECSICNPKPNRAEEEEEEEVEEMEVEEEEESDSCDDDGGHDEKRRLIPPRNQLRGGQIPSRAFPKPHGYRLRKVGYGSHLFRAMRRDRTKVSMPHHIIRKSSRSKRPKKSVLYDESVPYSHRRGYTWANTTSNELMARWQNLPYIKHGDGRITITGGKENSDTPFLYP